MSSVCPSEVAVIPDEVGDPTSGKAKSGPEPLYLSGMTYIRITGRCLRVFATEAMAKSCGDCGDNSGVVVNSAIRPRGPEP